MIVIVIETLSADRARQPNMSPPRNALPSKPLMKTCGHAGGLFDKLRLQCRQLGGASFRCSASSVKRVAVTQRLKQRSHLFGLRHGWLLWPPENHMNVRCVRQPHAARIVGA